MLSTKAMKDVAAETSRLWKDINEADKAHYDKEAAKARQWQRS